MDAIANYLQSENSNYIGTVMDQILIFNQHSIQLISGLIDYAECHNTRFLKKESNVYIDHISRNDNISMFSTKTKKMVGSRMKSRVTSRQSRIGFKKYKKEQNIKECLKNHLEQMLQHFLQIYLRLDKEIKFLDFENYFPLCKEIMTFFVNYTKLFYLKKNMCKPQTFPTFRDNTKTFIRLITPFLEKVTPIITEYLSYDPKTGDERFDWDSMDIKSDYSPYKKKSSVYKFETNVFIHFREVIDWVICILSLINIKKVSKVEMSVKKNETSEDNFQIPEKFQPLLDLIKNKGIYFNITDDYRKKNSNINNQKSKKQRNNNNENQKAKDDQIYKQLFQVTIEKTKEKTKENTKTRNMDFRKIVRKTEKEQIDTNRFAPDFLLPQDAYFFIDDYYVFKKTDEKEQENKDKEKADKIKEKNDAKEKKDKRDNKDDKIKFYNPRLIMLNCSLNSILPLIKQSGVNLYYKIPQALSALGLSSYEIMREFQNPKLDDVLYENNDLMLNISLVLSCVVSFIQHSEEISQALFDFVYAKTCPLLYKIADSTSANSVLTVNILEALYSVLNIVMDTKQSVRDQINNLYDDNIYFSLISVRISLIRILYSFLYLQSQSQLIGAFQMTQLLSQFYFNSSLIDNIEDLLMNVTKVDKYAYMLCNPLKAFNKNTSEKSEFKFQNNFFPAEIVSRSINFAFYNIEFGARIIYIFFEESDDKLSNRDQNFNTLIELSRKVLKRLTTSIIYTGKENKIFRKEKAEENNEKKEKKPKFTHKDDYICRYYVNRTLILINELGVEEISEKDSKLVDFKELTKKSIRREMKNMAQINFIDSHKKESNKEKKDAKKEVKKDENAEKKEKKNSKKTQKKDLTENEKEKNNQLDFISGDELCNFVFKLLTFYAPTFYRNGYFIDVNRCCVKNIKTYYFNYFIAIDSGSSDPVFNSIIEITKVVELLHPETVSEIALNTEASMKQKILDLVTQINAKTEKAISKKEKNEEDETNVGKALEILKIGKAHHFRQLLNVAIRTSWKHSDPAITTNYGMLQRTIKCGISLHPGNDEKIFDISTSSLEIFEKYFPKLLCNILTREKFFINDNDNNDNDNDKRKIGKRKNDKRKNDDSDNVYFDADKLCYPNYEYFPNGILYSLCATYFHYSYAKAKSVGCERIHKMAKKVFKLVHEKIFNKQVELLSKPKNDYNDNFIKLSRIQYRAYFFLGQALKLSSVLTNNDIEEYFSPYLYDEAIEFLSKYDTKEWHMQSKRDNKNAYANKHDSLRSILKTSFSGDKNKVTGQEDKNKAIGQEDETGQEYETMYFSDEEEKNEAIENPTTDEAIEEEEEEKHEAKESQTTKNEEDLSTTKGEKEKKNVTDLDSLYIQQMKEMQDQQTRDYEEDQYLFQSFNYLRPRPQADLRKRKRRTMGQIKKIDFNRNFKK